MGATAVMGFVGQVSSGASVADSLASASAANTQSFQFYTATGELFASVTGIFEILAPISIQTNTLAATMTFLQIEMDIQAGKGLNINDALTLAGNVFGVVGQMIILADAAPVAGAVIVGIGIAAGIGSLLTSSNLTTLETWTKGMVAAHWSSVPVADLSDMYLAGNVGDTGFTVLTYEEVQDSGDHFTGLRIFPDGTQQQIVDGVPVPPPPPNDPDCDGDGNDC